MAADEIKETVGNYAVTQVFLHAEGTALVVICRVHGTAKVAAGAEFR